MSEETGVPLARVCRLLAAPRSTIYAPRARSLAPCGVKGSDDAEDPAHPLGLITMGTGDYKEGWAWLGPCDRQNRDPDFRAVPPLAHPEQATLDVSRNSQSTGGGHGHPSDEIGLAEEGFENSS